MAELTATVAYILEPDWQIGAESTAPKEGASSISSQESIPYAWRRHAGLFLASRVLDYSRHILAQLRNLLGFSVAAALLILMGVSSYPFPSSDTLLRLSWIVVLGAVLLGMWIAVQSSREETLSLLSGGTPGRIDWNSAFVGHLALYALLPIVAILGIKFPATLDCIVRSVASILPGAKH